MSTFPLQVSSRGGGEGGGGGAGAGAGATGGGRFLSAGASVPRLHDGSVAARTSVRATTGRARPAISDPPVRGAVRGRRLPHLAPVGRACLRLPTSAFRAALN